MTNTHNDIDDNGTAFIEVWYNRFTRDWVVEAKTVDGYGSEFGSDYVYTLAEALDIANDKATQYGVPVRRVTSTGEAYKGRVVAAN